MIYDSRISPRGLVLVRRPDENERLVQPGDIGDAFVLSLTGESTPNLFRPDLTASYTVAAETNAAQAPLPDGGLKTFHLRRMPRSIQATIILSDFQILPDVNFRAGQPQNFLPEGERRSQRLLAALQGWRNSRAVFTALTQADRLPVAYISSMSVPATPEDGSAYTVNITIQEIEVFRTQRIDSVDDLGNDYGATLTRSGGLAFNENIPT